MKGENKLDKKQRISWGVSFGSLALVAGMVSYLGLSNGDKANNQSTSNQNNNVLNQQSQDNGFSQGQIDQGQSSNGDQSSQLNGGSSNNNFDNNTQFFGDSSGQNQFSNNGRGSGHHHGFDTTTGGT
jgi:hypothetical protein